MDKGDSMRRRRRHKSSGMFVVIAVIMILCFVVSYSRIDLDAKAAQYASKIVELNAQIEDENNRSKEIEELRVYMQTKKYVEEVARKKLGLVNKDEIIFRAVE